METTVKQRLVKYLKSKKIGQNRFEDMAGISNGYIANIKANPSADKIVKILNAAPDLNREWLLTGEGPMLVGGNERTGEGYPIVDSFTGSMGAPIGDGQVSQSFVGDRMSVPGINQPGTIYLRVYGDSMLCPERPEDSIPSGAFVSLRPSSLSTFRWGELYALVTTDGVLIKKVMPADDPDHITCVSLNAEKYPPFQLCQEEVAEAWRVTGIVTVRLK